MNWLSLIGIGFSVLVAIINVSTLIAIKFNDLKHFSKDLSEIKKSIDCIDKKLYKNAEKIGEIEGRCSANHPK
jgi:hypothetical protein